MRPQATFSFFIFLQLCHFFTLLIAPSSTLLLSPRPSFFLVHPSSSSLHPPRPSFLLFAPSSSLLLPPRCSFLLVPPFSSSLFPPRPSFVLVHHLESLKVPKHPFSPNLTKALRTDQRTNQWIHGRNNGRTRPLIEIRGRI